MLTSIASFGDLFIEIYIDQAKTIKPNAVYPTLFRCSDGTLIMQDRRSLGEGKTWLPCQSSTEVMIQLSDGSILALDSKTKLVRKDEFILILGDARARKYR